MMFIFNFLEKKEGAPLKIIRMSHVAGSVEGGKEVWLLSDKIDGNFFRHLAFFRPKFLSLFVNLVNFCELNFLTLSFFFSLLWITYFFV